MRSSILFIAFSLAAACGGSTSDTDSGVTDAHATTDAPSIDAPGTDGGGGHTDLGGCIDSDGDGHGAISCGGDDCDDHDASRYPGNPEVCDTAGHDDDCNPATLGPDHDGDGFPALTCCNTQASGTLLCGSDCNDTSMDISPSAPESCNGIDDNCNGMIDEALSTSPYRPDCDGDLFGDASATPMMLCAAPSTPPACPGGGWVIVGGDCDDMNPAAHPSAAEICNHVDDNCNGMIDEGLPVMTFHADCDGDGHGSNLAADVMRDCSTPAPPAGCPIGSWTTTDATDCCDADAQTHPGATSFFGVANACGNYDYNCDGTAEEQDTNFIVGGGCDPCAASHSCPFGGLGGPTGGRFWLESPSYCTVGRGVPACGATEAMMVCAGTTTPLSCGPQTQACR